MYVGRLDSLIAPIPGCLLNFMDELRARSLHHIKQELPPEL